VPCDAIRLARRLVQLLQAARHIRRQQILVSRPLMPPPMPIAQISRKKKVLLWREDRSWKPEAFLTADGADERGCKEGPPIPHATHFPTLSSPSSAAIRGSASRTFLGRLRLFVANFSVFASCSPPLLFYCPLLYCLAPACGTSWHLLAPLTHIRRSPHFRKIMPRQWLPRIFGWHSAPGTATA